MKNLMLYLRCHNFLAPGFIVATPPAGRTPPPPRSPTGANGIYWVYHLWSMEEIAALLT
jgi:hypothetical protein